MPKIQQSNQIGDDVRLDLGARVFLFTAKWCRRKASSAGEGYAHNLVNQCTDLRISTLGGNSFVAGRRAW